MKTPLRLLVIALTTLFISANTFANSNPFGILGEVKFATTPPPSDPLTVTTTTPSNACVNGINAGGIVLSVTGGSGVRYIKIKQNSTDISDYLALSEIQAYEIGTNTNVALNSDASKFTYNSMDGNSSPITSLTDNQYAGAAGYSSLNPGNTEFVQLDLSRPYNLSGIKIWNLQASSIWERNRNLQLELYDDSHNLISSRQINLNTGTQDNYFGVMQVSATAAFTNISYNSLTNLPEDTYNITVSDATGTVTATTSATIHCNFSVMVNPFSKCGSDPVVVGEGYNVTVTGGTPNYSYNWADGANNNIGTSPTITITPTQDSHYFLTVTDQNGATIHTSFTATAISPNITFSQKLVQLCGNSPIAVVTATVTGGNGDYTYLWNDASTTNTITITQGNNYILTVTDTRCNVQTVDTVFTVSVNPISVTATGANYCTNGTGNISLTVSGGMSGIRYIRVRQKSSDAYLTLNEIQAIELASNQNIALGAPPSQFTYNSVAQNDPTMISSLVDGDPAGNNYYVSSNQGTSEFVELDLSRPVNLSNILIAGAEQGASMSSNLQLELFDNNHHYIDIRQFSVADAPYIAPFNLLQLSATATTSGQGYPSVAGVPPDSYTITVTDGSPCGSTVVTSATITCSINISATPVSVCPNTSVTIGIGYNITVTDGTSPYNCRWALDGNVVGTSETITINPNMPSIYSLTVTDNTGASITTSVPVFVNPPLSVLIPPTPVTLNYADGSNYMLTVLTSGNVLSYQWQKNGNDISGATNSTYQILSSTSSDMGNYSCSVSDVCTSTVSPIFSITTTPNETFTIVAPTETATQTLCSGSNYTVSVVSSNANVFYQWQKDGNDIPGATSSVFNITNADINSMGMYYCNVSNGTSNLQSPVSNIIVVPPLSVVSPLGDVANSMCSGTGYDLSVLVTSPMVNYQWRKDGTNIPGATNSVYQISAASQSNVGNYVCSVSDICTSTASPTYRLSLLPTISILQPTTSVTVNYSANSNYTLSVVCSTNSGVSYQWQKNGADISGATNSLYQINAASQSDFGSYVCSVSNTCSSIQSAAYLLSNTPIVTFTIVQPTTSATQTLCVGASYSLSVQSSNANVNYQWQKDGVNISGATSSVYNITNADENSIGNYVCNVTNGHTSASSPVVNVVVIPPVVVLFPYTDVIGSLCSGTSYTISVVSASNFVNYQWQKDGVNIVGATNSTYQISSNAQNSLGNYVCSVSDNCTSAISPKYTLTTLPSISILQPTQSVTTVVCSGSQYVLSVLPSVFTVNYQWQKDGKNIDGATTPIYNLPNITENDYGEYVCSVSNCSSSVLSPKMVITGLTTSNVYIAASQYVMTSATATVTFSISGTTDLAYVVWNFGDGNYSGEFSPQHQYTEPNNYIVSANITNNDGCTLNLTPITITILKEVPKDSEALIMQMPTNDNIIINPLNGVIEELAVYNATGRLIMLKKVESQAQINLNLNALARGVYFVVLKNKSTGAIKAYHIIR